ncbi:MAG: T9SS type A sorting domain-containing protein [bacterium]|nr:T9SS type A sorting domain-containing protein [bacterium]
MKHTFSIALTFCLVAVTLVATDGDYVRVRADLKSQLERVQPDGSTKVSKQFRRWEWFWEARQTPDGGFPSSLQYATEAAKVNRRKMEPDVQAQATWVELGPTGPSSVSVNGGWNGIGRVNCVEISRTNPDLMFLGSAQGGIWKSVDAGSNWTAVNVPILPTFGVSDIAIAASNSNIIYVATGDANASIPGVVSNLPGFSYGVIKSVDGGTTWTTTGLTMTAESNNLVARLWVDPRNADIVVAATYTGIRRTTDGGATWNQVSNSAFYRDLVGNIDQPDILHAATSSRSGGAAIFRSIDNGLTWTLTKSVAAAQRIRLAVSRADANLVMGLAALASNSGFEGIYKSTTQGATYDKVAGSKNLLGWSSSGNDVGGQGQYDLALEIHQSNANHVFVGGVNIWRSTNAAGAFTLSAHNNGNGAPWVHADQHYLKCHPSRDIIYACHDGGIARSTNKGVSWTDISKGLKIQQYYALATSSVNTNITIAGAQDNGTTLSSNGTSFVHVLGGDGMDNAIDPENPTIMYGSSQYGNFSRSMNSGFNWDFIANAQRLGEPAGSWVTPIVTHPKTTGMVYVGYTNVHMSDNYGSNWEKISNFPQDDLIRHLAVAPSDDQYIYAGFNSSVKYTTNGGQTWQAQSGIGGGYIQDVQVHPIDAKRWWVTYGGYISTKIVEVKNGIVTNITGAGLPNVPCNAVYYQRGSPGRLYVGTDVGVFFKDDGSTSWSPFGNGMPTTIVTDISFITPTSKLRVATYGRGIWEITAQLCSAPQPQVSPVGPTTVCAGDSIELQASDGFAKYIWSNGSTSKSIRLGSVGETGTYTVNVEDANGCTNVSQPITITIKRSPTKPSITRRGGDTIRSSAIGGITLFQWYAGDVAVSGGTQREFVPQQSGTYSVTVTNSDGCTVSSEPYTFVIGPVSVQDDVAATFAIYPNPTDGDVRIQLPPGMSRIVEVVNTLGTVVLMSEAIDGVTDLSMSLSNVASGTYFVRVRAGESVWMRQLVKR